MRRLISTPKIAQLDVDVWMRGVVKAFWIIHTFLVPAFDFVRNDGCFLQRHSIKQRPDLRRGWRVCQSFISNRADNLVAIRAVSLDAYCKSDRKKDCGGQRAAGSGFHFLNWPTIQLNLRLPSRWRESVRLRSSKLCAYFFEPLLKL